ncbi:MAG: hypothetical protein IJQ24_06230, partial [Synergistaceae bacterium]|nr:hypothetical protein [Synergistaceae bacterium]
MLLSLTLVLMSSLRTFALRVARPISPSSTRTLGTFYPFATHHYSSNTLDDYTMLNPPDCGHLHT